MNLYGNRVRRPGKYGLNSNTGEYIINILIDKNFWKKKRVFITGHTGFKGAWLCLWLHVLGAKVTGYALSPPTTPNLFDLCKINSNVDSLIADIRDIRVLKKAVHSARPEIILHMAAQSLVRESYKNPVETYSVNVMGTINLLEAVRHCKGIQAVVNVTTDKCYENGESYWGYRENEPLGGYDPYSNSKACSELMTSAYRNSFFHSEDYHNHGVGLATARAGNVIGGGDWSADRLIPDCIRALLMNKKVVVRNPDAIRPWQHVLEPLYGYLLLAKKLTEKGPGYSEAWNFGPNDGDVKPVEWVVRKICEKWGGNASYETDTGEHPHEARYLKLDCSKARTLLGWHPRWNLETAIDKVIEWTRAYKDRKNLRKVCLKQIEEYSMRDLNEEIAGRNPDKPERQKRRNNQ